MRAIGQRLGHGADPARLAGAALGRPQVSGMSLVVTCQHLCLTVLRKQRHGRDLLTRKYSLQKFHQRKMRALQRTSSFLRAIFGPLHEAIDRRLHAAHHLCRGRDTHHLQCTTSLVQLLARNAQRRCIQLFQIRQTGSVRIAHETAYRFSRSLQRLAHLIEHPGQWAQVLLL